MAVSLTVRYYRNEIVANLQSYDLRVVVESAVDMPEKIFVLQRIPGPPGGEDEDKFQCIADPVDLEEIPEDSPDLGNEMPYFRVQEITIRFRSMETLEEVRQLIAEDLQALVNSLKAAESLELMEEVTYA
jgi:hypothetical protein